MLEQILTLLGLSDPTEAMQAKVETILALTQQRFFFLTGQTEVPEALTYIIVEVVIARFNRIGSEGAVSHSVQGESLTWSDSDFDPYMDDIQSWLNAQKEPTTTRGRVRFI